MPKSPNSTQISVTLSAKDRPVFNEIVKRAKQLGPRYTHSSFAGDILRWWHAQGCPAVSAQDQAMILAAQMAKSKDKTIVR